jgi:hypothetical protein
MLTFPRLVWNLDPPTTASEIVEITGVSHHAQAWVLVLNSWNSRARNMIHSTQIYVAKNVIFMVLLLVIIFLISTVVDAGM